jgi:hypothetical protein
MKSTIAHIIDEEIFNTHYPLETDAEFLTRVTEQIFNEMKYLNKLAPSIYNNEIKEEIEDQIFEVFKIKTYGYLSLQHYRKVHRPKSQNIG